MTFTKGHKINVGRICKKETRKKIGLANSIALKGRVIPKETREKISIATRGKSRPPISEQAKQKMRDAKLKNPTRFWLGKKRPNLTGSTSKVWKGDEVKYRGLHNWVERVLGKPTSCEHCPKKNLMGHSIHWANKSGKYLRDKKDWLRLCVPCHKKFDKKTK